MCIRDRSYIWYNKAVWRENALEMLPNGSVSVGDTMYFRRISDLRVDHDLTQRKVADYLNMNLEVYRRYEKGLREIPVWALVKLAELYHTSTDYLLGRTDNPSPPRA